MLRWQLLGANPRPTARGLEEQKFKVNYLRGPDRSKWQTGIAAFAKVSYDGVYPGVDLVYHGDQARRLEYDFVVAPGADPAVIEFAIAGADAVAMDENGDLEITIRHATVKQHAPVAYQVLAGVRVPVAARYLLKGADRVAFEVADYDTSSPLVIDPVLSYSSFLGGSDYDVVIWSDLGPDGAYYVAGATLSTDFPTTAGVYSATSLGGFDVIISKFAADGSLAYSTYLGGGGDDLAIGLGIDREGHAIVAGHTWSPDFPVSPEAFQKHLAGDSDAFVTKLTADGSGLVYSTYLGGTGNDWAFINPVDAQGNTYVMGYTDSTDFPTTRGAFQRHNAGLNDAFVTKLSPKGRIIYSTYVGGSGDDFGYDGNIDAAGHAFLDGYTLSTDFPVTRRALQSENRGGSDVFAFKLADDGSHLEYATYLGGSGEEGVLAFGVNDAGNGYIIGWTSSTDFPVTHDAFQTAYGGGNSDGFLTKINRNGSAILLSTFIGGSSNDYVGGVEVDRFGNMYLDGYTASPDFVVTEDAFQREFGGVQDVFVMKLSASGSLRFSSFLGGSNYSYASGQGTALDADCNFFFAGGTAAFDFPTTANAAQRVFMGVEDAFVAKVSFGRPNGQPCLCNRFRH